MTLKAVLIVGSDSIEIFNSSQIKSLYSQPGYLIIGDGNMQPVSPELILSSLKDNIDSNTRIDIYAHGSPTPQNKDLLGIQLDWDEKDDNAESIFALLKEINNSRPLNLHIWSCHSGLANKSLKHLPEGSLLFTHVSGDVTAFAPLCAFAFINSTQEWGNTIEEISSHKFLKAFLSNFAYDSIEGSSVATWRSQEGEQEEYIFNVMPTLREVMMDPAKVLNEKLDHYIEFCKESFELTDLKIPDISELAETFRFGYFLHHCAHGKQEEVISIIKELELPTSFFEQHINHFTPVQAAILKNQEKIVEFLLKEKNVHINFQDVLHTTIREGAINILNILHKCGANLNEPIYYGLTPLEVALNIGQDKVKESVEFLLTHGAIWDYEKVDLFDLAIRNKEFDTLKFLLDFESLEDQSTKYGFTQLYKAVLSQDKEAIRTILEGDDNQINQSDNKGNTPLHAAVALCDNETVSLLLEYQADPNKTNERGSTPLHVAASQGFKDIAAMLLKSKANPEIQNQFGYTPLHLSTINGRQEIVELLLSTADFQNHVDKLDKDGSTALYLAFKNQHSKNINQHNKIIKLLIDAGADLTIPTPDGSTLLYTALMSQNMEVIKLLVNIEKDLNQENQFGYTLLYVAALYGQKPEVVKFLLEKGADPMIRCNSETIIDSLKQNTSCSPEIREIIEIVEKAISDEMDKQEINRIYNLAKMGDQESISALKANINQQNDYGFTALHLAAQENNVEMIELLIKFGSNPHLMNKYNQIPLCTAVNENNTDSALILIPHTNLGIPSIQTNSVLHLATKKGNVVIAKALIDAGADIKKVDSLGTPLSIAASGGHKDIVELLIRHGADLNQLNGLGETSLYAAACYQKNVEAVRFLLEKGADPSIECHGTSLLDALKTQYKYPSLDYKTVVELIEKAIRGKEQENTDTTSSHLSQDVTSTSDDLESSNIQDSNEAQNVNTIQVGIIEDTQGEMGC